MTTITENSVKIKAELPEKDVHRKMDVFYNPQMKSNRNISVLLLNCLDNKEMNIALPLAGSGIRGLRFLQELKKGKMERLLVNDKKENFVKVFNDNLKLNNIGNKANEEKQDRIIVKNEDAEHFLLNQHTEDFCGYFDYIDIDPFGTPNPFLSAAVARIKRGGIIAITATDTAALTGTYPKVTKRKYWATSLKNYLMHETGLRILIRKVQLQGIQFDKALTPILSYHKDHYFRVYFKSEKGKEKCDDLLRKHQYLLFCPKCLNFEVSNYNCKNCDHCKDETKENKDNKNNEENQEKMQFAGPLWTGQLFDQKLIRKMAQDNPFPEEQKFLDILRDETKIDMVGFYDLHVIGKKYRSDPKKMEPMLKMFKGVRTHFSLQGIKSKKKIKEISAVK